MNQRLTAFSNHHPIHLSCAPAPLLLPLCILPDHSSFSILKSTKRHRVALQLKTEARKGRETSEGGDKREGSEGSEGSEVLANTSHGRDQ